MVTLGLFPHFSSSQAGADMVEIGNYDGFYAEGRVFSAEEILKLTKRTRLVLLPRFLLTENIVCFRCMMMYGCFVVGCACQRHVAATAMS
jgi:hypothetical protein